MDRQSALQAGTDPDGGAGGGGAMDRRRALKTMGVGALGLGALGIGAAYAVPGPLWSRFTREVREGTYQLRFFTGPEEATVRVLADMIIPADERSGSATEAGTVEYMDFVLGESGESTQERWRFGLAWLDSESARLHGVARFVDATPAQRAQVLDQVAWPERATAEEEAVRWFTSARDLVGSGFFSSRMGVEDIAYMGGYMIPAWTGAPPAALEELGLSYEAWDRRYGDAGVGGGEEADGTGGGAARTGDAADASPTGDLR